ncbi:glycosyltransferase family 2 protein [Microvirga sp. 2TAF3]|uniref:glycosyltransferase family 2 protein n=1 Tax=Microvirga sp. 2TAF3 TaxID=3233014 RepID=UPI003F9ACEA4
MTIAARHPMQSDPPQPARGEILTGTALLGDQLSLPTDGETVVAAPVGDDLVLISGVTDTMPSVVPVLLNGDPSMSMTASVLTWIRRDVPPEASIGFVAVVPVQVAGRVRIRSIVMRRKGQQARYTLIRRALPLSTFMNIVSGDAGSEFPQVADGVTQALLTGRNDPKRIGAALSLLTATARNDGFVEVMGTVDTGEILLQGWSSELPVDQSRLIVSHDGLVTGEFKSAKVQRDDLGERGYGFVGILDTGDTTVDLQRLQRLFFRGHHGWRTLDIYDRRVHLASTDVPAHIRDVLPRAAANSETLTTLRRAGERFDGRDTVSGLKEPVRIGMDMVLELPKGGLLVSGWMLDPERLVESVILHVGKQSAAIDGTWTRLARPDVTTAFQQDGAFAQRLDPQRHDHGFLAFVPGLSSASQEPVYFELSVGGETAAFYPLKPIRWSSRRALDRVMSVLDPRSAATTMAIETHIGPMIQSFDHQKPRAIEFRDFGYDESASRTGLIVGGGFETEDILVALCLLALDPDTRDVPIIVSVPAELFGRIAVEVQRLASFYSLGIRLVAADGVQDTCDALEAAVHVTKLETLIFLSAGVLPRRQGWLPLMERAYRTRGGKVLVSPTVVFEDNSICFAGTLLDQHERKLVDRYLGYPCDAIRDAEPTEVMAGSTACFIVSRSAFQDIGGFSQTYLSVKEKGRDLCLKLKLAGTPSLWLPEVEMIAADIGPDEANLPWQRLTQHVDRWSFDRRWSLLVANMRGVE